MPLEWLLTCLLITWASSDAICATIDSPDITTDGSLKYVKGPDSTGGYLWHAGVKEAYRTGKGKIVVRSKIEIEQNRVGKVQNNCKTEIPTW